MSGKAPFVDAMMKQPTTLQLAYDTLIADLEQGNLSRWHADETIAVIAMGASGHSGQAVVSLLSQAGYRAVSLTASDVLRGAVGFQPAEHYIIVSESGRSPETIEAARRLTPGSRVGISNFPKAQIAEVIDVALGLGGFEDSPVYTAGYTATLMAYALLFEKVGVLPADPNVPRIPEIVKDALLELAPVARAISSLVAEATAIDVIGQGTSFASALETALMIREGLRIPTGSFETYEFLHGPMESASAGTVVLIFGDERELAIPGSILDAGVHVVVITTAHEVPNEGHPNLTIVRLSSNLTGFVRPIIEVVFAQLLLAEAIVHKPFAIEKFIYEQPDTKIPIAGWASADDKTVPHG
ncbi:SIS domain-containing protein [Cryobacterium sp. Y29]|uniref:SIS domain-containing protein n=1 Tax=Cryobacterium sp. Y29 TaxID=2048285 RepID=UPI000CE52865|nr:SIS domain-containing protein [Cryobacterium sp. Y29]